MEGQQQHYARPTTLYPLRLNDSGIIANDVLQPKREPIKFDVALVGAPHEVEQLVSNIKQVAEQFLYHWKTFPLSEYFLLFKKLILNKRIFKIISDFKIIYMVRVVLIER